MLSRNSSIRHPSGVIVKTPLLVPSFSSRGFGVNTKKRSVLRDIFSNTAEVITESMLVSAYDIYYGNLPQPKYFRCTPGITIVDSGGYEVGVSEDWSSAYKGAVEPQDWELENYIKVLDSWPNRIPAVFVNFDKCSVNKGIPRQLKFADQLFSHYPEHLHCFLLKPTKSCKGEISNTIQICQKHVKELGNYDIIGITEKELGHSMLDRMEILAKFRRSLDEAGVTAPIQVFGALDPISSTLYFLSGAEIFDGLTWLRYAFQDGKCIYPQNVGALKSIDSHDDFIRADMLSSNYYAITNLQLALRDFCPHGDFDKLSPHNKFFKRAYDSLCTRLGGRI